MQIDKRRLAELSDEVDQLHHESMRTLRDGATRRSFLTKAATGGGLLTVGSMVAPISRFVPAATAQEAPVSDDVELAMFMAGLELAAVEIYRAAAATGKLTNAGNQIATMFGGHHQDHADALNEIIGEDAARHGAQRGARRRVRADDPSRRRRGRHPGDRLLPRGGRRRPPT